MPSVPGSLIAVTSIREGKYSLRVSSTSHLTSRPALRLIVEGCEIGRLNRIDRDAFAGRQDADDAVARDRAAVRRETHRQVALQPPDRNRLMFRRPFRTRTLKARLVALVMPNQPASLWARIGAGLRSSLNSGCTALTTSPEYISPRPTAASTSSSLPRASRGRALFNMSSDKALPARSKARATICRPRPVYCARTAVARRPPDRRTWPCRSAQDLPMQPAALGRSPA